MNIRCEIETDKQYLIVKNHPNYHKVTVIIADDRYDMSIDVDGPTLIKAIQNAMND